MNVTNSLQPVFETTSVNLESDTAHFSSREITKSPHEMRTLILNGNCDDAANYRVDENLEIQLDDNTPNKIIFPRSLSVCGDLAIGGYRKQFSLPVCLDVKGDLKLYQSRQIIRWPSNLNVDGNVEMHRCAIDDNKDRQSTLKIKGCFSIYQCYIGANLGEMEVFGSLSMTDVKLHDTFSTATIHKNFEFFSSCVGEYNFFSANKQACFSKVTVNDSLRVTDCNYNEYIGNHLTVEGDVTISECDQLVQIGDHCNFRKKTCFKRNEKLTTIGNHYSASNITIENCQQLKKIGDYLTLSNSHRDDDPSLKITGPNTLTTIGEHSSIKGNVDLSGCESLQTLFDTGEINGHVFLSGCTQLTDLPATLTQKSRTGTGYRRIIDVENSGLSEDKINHLIQQSKEGAYIYDHNHRRHGEDQFDSFEDAIQYWHSIAERGNPRQKFMNDTALNKSILRKFLGRLTELDEFNRGCNEKRASMGGHVVRLIRYYEDLNDVSELQPALENLHEVKRYFELRIATSPVDMY